VLIVDDDRDIVELLQEVLVGAGYDVHLAITGSDAVTAATAFRPAVVLLDLSMPDMTGDQVLQSLLKHGVSAPVIAMSGLPEHAGPGFFAVMGKPLRLREVRQVVADAVRTVRAPGA
jgi:DNA-binding response OmpR family regulator